MCIFCTNKSVKRIDITPCMVYNIVTELGKGRRTMTGRYARHSKVMTIANRLVKQGYNRARVPRVSARLWIKRHRARGGLYSERGRFDRQHEKHRLAALYKSPNSGIKRQNRLYFRKRKNKTARKTPKNGFPCGLSLELMRGFEPLTY